MKISKLAMREARQLFRSCQANGLLDENRVRLTIKLLGEKKPRGYVQILSRLHRLVELDVQQRTARVESAEPLPAGLQTEVTGRIKKNYGDGLDISFSQNPALIGGLKIRVGSDLYDGTVKTKLERLAASF
jgi:F-type H+-transporting ATPase subunit delta